MAAPAPPAPAPIATRAAVLDDVADAMGWLADLDDGGVERAAVLFLDPKRRCLGRADFTGARDAVAPPLRAIVAEALRRDAAALILAHNHPSGSPDPSPADLAYTRTLARVGAALGLTLLDHLIVAGDRVTSLRRAGLL